MSEENAKGMLKAKFMEYQVPSATHEDWDDIERELEKKRFFRFAYNRFNIYYLLFIGSYGLVTTFLTGLYIKQYFAKTELESSTHLSNIHKSAESLVSHQDTSAQVHVLPKQIIIYRDFTDMERVTSGVPTDLNEKNNLSQTDSSISMTSHQQKNILPEVKDSVAKVPSPTIERKKNPIVVNKHDTIRKYDTVYVHKKKRLRVL